jgi:hypothetical protein
MAFTQTELNFVIAVAAVIALVFTIWELQRSRKISCSHAEAAIIGEFNKWTLKYNMASNNLEKYEYVKNVINVLEMLIKSVKRGVYPFNEYKTSFFPVTIQYIRELEMAYYNVKNKKSDAFEKDFGCFSEVLLPVFDIYIKMSKEIVGENRTVYNLKKLANFEVSELPPSDYRKLKFRIKHPQLYEILRILYDKTKKKD